jgi:hypothetical protein
MVMAGKKRRRTELREAQRALDRAQKRQRAGLVREHGPATEAEQGETARLVREVIKPRLSELRSMAAGGDLVVVVCALDASDRAAAAAAGRVLRLQGDLDGAMHAEAAAAADILFLTKERSSLLRELSDSPEWPASALELLRSPPPGALLLVVDGSATGHSVLSFALLASGGEA